MKKLFVFLAFLEVSFLAFGQSITYRTLSDIPYYPEADRRADAYIRERCVLDLYVPTGEKGFPTVVWFHGGGLTGGNKSVPE
nr:hypothetical protein [Haliscomenobacter sp.]